jgi:hypothetical protein
MCVDKRSYMRHVKLFTVCAAIWTTTFISVGCGAPQSGECEKYIECRRWYEAVFNRPQKELNVYEPDGVCWENDDLASDCSAACEDETQTLNEKLVEANEAAGACAD